MMNDSMESIYSFFWWLGITIPIVLLMFALIAIVYLVGEFLSTRCNPITRVMGIYFIRIVVYILTFNAIGYHFPSIDNNQITDMMCLLIITIISLDTIAINWVLFRNIKAHIQQIKLNPKESRVRIYRICLSEKNFIKKFYDSKIIRFYRFLSFMLFIFVGVLAVYKSIFFWSETTIDQNIIMFFGIIGFAKYYTFKCVDNLR